jgi:FAD/FMN-containing dehydrogenase
MLNAFTHDTATTLQSALPDLPLKQAEPRYLEEPRGKWTGLPTYVAAPRNTEDVATIVRFANTHCFGLQPFGGGTGLVGGQLTTKGPEPLILSLENMKAIRAIHPQENTLIAEAGVTLETIHAAAADINRLFPLTYGSKGTAQIGAGLAVNSGGLNVLRYGMARDLCLGIEAVLPNGDILHGLKRLKKDNTGYDLRHLLIGSEGTLGIITAAALKLSPRPAHTATAFLVVPSPTAALELLARTWDAAGEVISAFEILSGTGFQFLKDVFPDMRQPFATPPDWSVLVEIATSAGTDPQAILESVFADAFENGLVTDGLIASSGQQADDFWAVRETIPLANRIVGAIASHDISLPLSHLAEFIDTTHKQLHEIAPIRINCFGHLGDGNLHYNVYPPAGKDRKVYADIAAKISHLVHDNVVARGGSFSAEHGIGRLKTADLARYADPTKLATMRTIKAAFDPNGIMNPGAVIAAN